MLYFIGLVVLLVVYFYVTTVAVSIGVRSGVGAWFQEYLDYLESKETDSFEEEVIQDIKDGVIDEAEGNKILRNIRGEK